MENYYVYINIINTTAPDQFKHESGKILGTWDQYQDCLDVVIMRQALQPNPVITFIASIRITASLNGNMGTTATTKVDCIFCTTMTYIKYIKLELHKKIINIRIITTDLYWVSDILINFSYIYLNKIILLYLCFYFMNPSKWVGASCVPRASCVRLNGTVINGRVACRMSLFIRSMVEPGLDQLC